jgi:hypothetical protein
MTRFAPPRHGAMRRDSATSAGEASATTCGPGSRMAANRAGAAGGRIPYGLSSQIVPRRLVELLGHPDPAAATRVRDAMLAMRKIDVATLEAAHSGPA